MSIHVSATCPFCGLCCDDLRVDARDDGHLRLRGQGCERAATALREATPLASPMIAGRPVSRAQALERAAGILTRAERPLYAGLAADIEGVKALLHLAERTGGIVDHARSQAYFRNARVVQREGWITTTFGEIRNRADLIIMAGTDGVSATPPFFPQIYLEPHRLVQAQATRAPGRLYWSRPGYGTRGCPGWSPPPPPADPAPESGRDFFRPDRALRKTPSPGGPGGRRDPGGS